MGRGGGGKERKENVSSLVGGLGMAVAVVVVSVLVVASEQHIGGNISRGDPWTKG